MDSDEAPTTPSGFAYLVMPRFADARATRGRSEFERDQDRIIFSTAFRRLNDKTQVFPVPESYFVHNRMTHSLETSAVGRSLGSIVGERVLEPRYGVAAPGSGESGRPQWGSEESRLLGDLVRAACLAHDIGNPPFGHSGEDAMSAFFRGRADLLSGLSRSEAEEFRRFEGNAQGLRVISRISPDLRLTANTIAAFTKYPRQALVEGWIEPEYEARRDMKKYGAFASEAATLEGILTKFGSRRLASPGFALSRFPFAWLVEAADDICYLIIDLEDAVRLRIVRLSEVEPLLEAIVRADPEGLPDLKRASQGDESQRMAFWRAKAINSLVFQCAEAFGKHVDGIGEGSWGGSLVQEIPGAAALEAVRRLSEERIYRDRPVLEIEAAGFEVLGGLLDIFTSVALEPPASRGVRASTILEILPAIAPREGEDRYQTLRRVTDYAAGMTDSYALSLYRKLKGVALPRMY
ncbi:MAG TPA: dNTP triphosphohydrolase [Rectinemataceae bacterium]|nr:dNTP triphosphohydrolase [Rectinemataceae bacterium]